MDLNIAQTDSNLAEIDLQSKKDSNLSHMDPKCPKRAQNSIILGQITGREYIKHLSVSKKDDIKSIFESGS